MNYEIIADKAEVLKFINWLPSSSDSEQYYCTLFARRKYLPDHPALKSDKTMISRWTSVKERLINKIEQHETKIGTYLGHADQPIPQEALACYITPSPRDFNKASFRLIKSLADHLEKDIYVNPRQEAMNIIQTTPVKNMLHVFDIDSKNSDTLNAVLTILKNICNVIETRGGYHIIANPSELRNEDIPKHWYVQLKALSDVSGDALVPIPGTFQGGYIPKLIHISPKHNLTQPL